MTQEEKELILKDLCARLQYGVKVRIYNPYRGGEYEYEYITIDNFNEIIDTFGISCIKPYLFPMSSMTDEQNDSWRDAWFPDLMSSTDINYPESEKYLALSHSKSMEWLYKHYFDVNGLIEKGLAIDATGLNIY